MKMNDDMANVEALEAARQEKAKSSIVASKIINLVPALRDDLAIKKALDILIDIVRERNTTVAIPSSFLESLGADAREQLRQSISRLEAVSARASIAKHPHHLFEYIDIRKFSETYFRKKAPPFITQDSVISALGSCFAVNVTEHLQSLGYDASVGLMAEQVNNSYTNLGLMRSFIDEFAFDEIFNKSIINCKVRDSFLVYREAMLRSDVIIYTLGLSYAFYNKKTGTPLSNPVQSYLSETYRNYEMKPIPVNENLENIYEIIRIVRKLRPSAKILFSLSPIPLDGILDHNQSVIEADCLSKSIGRVTLSQVEANSDKFGGNILYFPSFEIARWVACNQSNPLFGAADGWARHLDREVINAIMDVFMDFYCVRK